MPIICYNTRLQRCQQYNKLVFGLASQYLSTSSGVMCTANIHWTSYTKLHIFYALTSILRPSPLWGHTMHRTYWERHWWACQAVTRTRWGAEIHEDTSREVSQCDLWGHLSNCQEYICTVDNVSKATIWKELVQSDREKSASPPFAFHKIIWQTFGK